MEPMARKSGGGPTPFSEVLRGHFQTLGWERKFRELEVFQRWEEAVGPQIARRARPSQVRNHRLTIVVNSPAWAQQLSLMKKELLSSFTRILGEDLIRDLYFVSGTVEETRVPEKVPEPPAEPLDDETLRRIEEEASRIPDGELREAFRKTLRAASRRRRSRL